MTIFVQKSGDEQTRAVDVAADATVRDLTSGAMDTFGFDKRTHHATIHAEGIALSDVQQLDVSLADLGIGAEAVVEVTFRPMTMNERIEDALSRFDYRSAASGDHGLVFTDITSRLVEGGVWNRAAYNYNFNGRLFKFQTYRPPGQWGNPNHMVVFQVHPNNFLSNRVEITLEPNSDKVTSVKMKTYTTRHGKEMEHAWVIQDATVNYRSADEMRRDQVIGWTRTLMMCSPLVSIILVVFFRES